MFSGLVVRGLLGGAAVYLDEGSRKGPIIMSDGNHGLSHEANVLPKHVQAAHTLRQIQPDVLGPKTLGQGCHELRPGHANIHLQEFSSTIARNYRSSLEWLLGLGLAKRSHS